MKVFAPLGGDGFCGWPTSLYLSHRGYDVTIIDNLSRRKIDVEMGVQSLTPIATVEQRLAAWKDVSGKDIAFHDIDVDENYHRLLTLIVDEDPDVIIHFAEQRAAPYSMKSSYHKRYTVNNNLNATNNLCAAVVEARSDAHIVRCGQSIVAGKRIEEDIIRLAIIHRDSIFFGTRAFQDNLSVAACGDVDAI